MNFATPMRLKSKNGKCTNQEQLCFHHQGYCGLMCYHDFGTTMIIPSNHLINGVKVLMEMEVLAIQLLKVVLPILSIIH